MYLQARKMNKFRVVIGYISIVGMKGLSDPGTWDYPLCPAKIWCSLCRVINPLFTKRDRFHTITQNYPRKAVCRSENMNEVHSSLLENWRISKLSRQSNLYLYYGTMLVFRVDNNKLLRVIV